MQEKIKLSELLETMNPETLYIAMIKDKDDNLVKRTFTLKEEGENENEEKEKELQFNLTEIAFSSTPDLGNGKQKVNTSIVASHFKALDYQKVKEAIINKDQDLMAKLDKNVKIKYSYKDKDGIEKELKVPKIDTSLKLDKELLDKFKYAKTKEKSR